MTSDTTKPLTLTVTQEVPATLIVRPSYGDERPVWPEDLARLGYRHYGAMYERFRYLCKMAGIDNPGDDPRWNILRYFVEYVTMYDHDMDPDDLARFAAMMNSADPCTVVYKPE